MERISIWRETSEASAHPSLDGSLSVDTVIIGGGMAGILTAWMLKERGVECVVLEEEQIGSGQTENTTAKITSQHNCIYDTMIKNAGQRLARQYADANQEAIGEYRRIINAQNINCDWEKRTSCLYTKERPDILKRECEAAQSLGIGAGFSDTTELPFSVAGALMFEEQAAFHPLKFLNHLAKDVTVFEKTKVKKVEEQEIFTDRGQVKAKHIVFACHYPFVNAPGYYFLKMHQERSYVLAIQDANPMKTMYLGIDKEGLSFRSYKNTLLIGGGGHRTGENIEGGQYEKLLLAAHTYWPQTRATAHWSAQDCVTLDHIPYIGKYAHTKNNWYVATGFGKWGMTSSMVSAMILSDMIAGRDNPWAEVFSPQRENRKPFNALANEGGHAIRGLVGVTKGTDTQKRCSHLGCKLTWNPEEESYDCPCHGSRFDKEGNRLDGPSQCGL